MLPVLYQGNLSNSLPFLGAKWKLDTHNGYYNLGRWLHKEWIANFDTCVEPPFRKILAPDAVATRRLSR